MIKNLAGDNGLTNEEVVLGRKIENHHKDRDRSLPSYIFFIYKAQIRDFNMPLDQLISV